MNTDDAIVAIDAERYVIDVIMRSNSAELFSRYQAFLAYRAEVVAADLEENESRIYEQYEQRERWERYEAQLHAKSRAEWQRFAEEAQEYDPELGR